jgi:hydroxymethylpyrimidine pyrophosphatase-like HAD family hydrolase
MAPLYVSDLDFTLLRSDATLGARTVDVVNRLIAAGHHFTCATARSYKSAVRITAGLRLTLPLITFGGAVRFDPGRGSIDNVEPLPAETVDAITAVTEAHPRVEPLLFAMVDGRDRVCWRETHATDYVDSFTSRRANDPRLLPLLDWGQLIDAPVFYATLIGERDDIDGLRRDELLPVLTDCFDTVGPDGYNPQHTWFEIMSTRATKAAAARGLADQIGADQLIAFGEQPERRPAF